MLPSGAAGADGLPESGKEVGEARRPGGGGQHPFRGCASERFEVTAVREVGRNGHSPLSQDESRHLRAAFGATLRAALRETRSTVSAQQRVVVGTRPFPLPERPAHPLQNGRRRGGHHRLVQGPVDLLGPPAGKARLVSDSTYSAPLSR